MRLMLRLFLLLPLLCATVLSPAQIVKDPTTWTYELKQIKGTEYKAIFHLKLAKGWHTWSLKPGGDGLQISPSFTFDKNDAAKPKGNVQESGKKITGPMDGVDGIVSYFENEVDYTQLLMITKGGKVTGKLEYQVCNETMCLPPKKKAFVFDAKGEGLAATPDTAVSADTTPVAAVLPVPVDTGSKVPQSSKSDVAITAATTSNTTMKATSTNDFLLFIEGFGAGLISVLTPCVFAMLPMTVSFFLKRSKDRKTGVTIALQYSLSIILIFTAIGALFAVFFKPDTLHAFSTNWLVNLFFAAIFLIFGVSFLGAFEINLPSSWATKMDTKANTRNLLGIFFMALTLVIVSFSCTGPFITAMIKAMGQGGKFGPLIGFCGYGVGLALPFALFAIFPSLLNTLGKSGGWLNALKVAFGFIEIALALKFLSNADVQKGWRLLDREIFLAIWIALSVLLGAYLLGSFRFSHDSELPKNDWGLPYLKVPRFLFALSSFVFAMYLMPGMWGAPLNFISGQLPPMGTQSFVLGKESSSSPTEGPQNGNAVMPVKYVAKMKPNEPPVVVNFGLTVFFDFEEALAASKKAGKPVMLDFTGIVCANCRNMEAKVWSDPEVMKRLKNDFIIASLYTDANNVDLPKNEHYFSKELEEEVTTLGKRNLDIEYTKYGANSSPKYFFVDEKGDKLYERGLDYPTAVPVFIKILEEVKAKYKSTHS